MTGETRPLERLTASDLFLLMWDDYGWATDIGGLAILDGTSLLDSDGRVRIEAVHRYLEPRLHLIPRFRQLLRRPPLDSAGLYGSTHPLLTSPTTFESTSSLLRRTKPACSRPVRNWHDAPLIRIGRFGSCGCCRVCPRGAWAPT